MAKLTIDWNTPAGKLGLIEQPRRGDVLHAKKAVYHVISIRQVKRRVATTIPRFSVTVVRQSEIEPELEAALERSAARRGGRKVFHFTWYPRKKSRSFEDLIRGV